jgi:PAS domain S-box-containing protein
MKSVSSVHPEHAGSRAPPPSSRRANLALGFVVLSLIALVIVPHWVGSRTNDIRHEIGEIVEPARAEVDRMVTQFDREVAAVRGYRLSGDADYLARYEAARAGRLDATQQARPFAEQLGEPAPTLLSELGSAAGAWEASHQRFLVPGAPANAVPTQGSTREAQYDAVIHAGERLETQLRLEAAVRRQRIEQEERQGLILAAILALMALLAALAVAAIAHRLGSYGRESERLYRESRVLAVELGQTVRTLQQRTTEAEAEVRERQRAEEALHAEEERFRALADNIPQLAWMADQGGSIFWYNRRWYDYTATTPEEMQDWGWTAVHHPAHLDRVTEGFRRALAEHRPWEDTFPLRSLDGEYRWFLSRAVPIRDGDGEVTLWFGTNTDVTEQREAAAERERLAVEIDRQRLLLKTVTDNATSALLVMDTEGRGTFWNPAAERMTGYSAGEAMGRTLHELIHHTYPDGTHFPIEQCPIDQALPKGVEVEGYEDVFIRRNGEFFPVICAAKPIVEDGRPAGTVIEVRDVTAERQAEEALRRAKDEAEGANRAKSEFLATMSHELRTPLNAILGFADLMDLGIPEPLPEKSLAQVKRIDESARHLLSIIEQILTFSRVEAEQERVVAEVVHLREVLRSTVEIAEPLAVKKGLRVITDIEAAPDVIVSDAQKLRQILLNLLGNAVKFTEQGEVGLTVRRESGDVVIRVRDTGIGIAPEHLVRVFDPFWQVDQSYRRTAGGTGLGLTVSRSLARLLGGDLHAESAPGVGSTFEVRLPYRAEPAAATAPPSGGGQTGNA